MPLFLGYNDLSVHAETAAGNKSAVVGGQIHRMLIGDVNVSRRVDDADISPLSRELGTSTLFRGF